MHEEGRLSIRSEEKSHEKIHYPLLRRHHMMLLSLDFIRRCAKARKV